MENQRKPRKYGILAEEQQKKREETAGDKDEKKTLYNSSDYTQRTIIFLSPSLNFFRKRKEEIKRNGMMEKRRKRDGEGGAEWLLTEGPIGK